MINFLRRLFRRPKPLSLEQRILVFVLMQDRLQRTFKGEQVEPIEDMVNHVLALHS